MHTSPQQQPKKYFKKINTNKLYLILIIVKVEERINLSYFNFMLDIEIKFETKNIMRIQIMMALKYYHLQVHIASYMNIPEGRFLVLIIIAAITFVANMSLFKFIR